MRIYDNGGDTLDRYTIVTEEGGGMVFGMSTDPFSPQGFNQYCGEELAEGAEVGKLLTDEEVRTLPHDVLLAIILRINDNV